MSEAACIGTPISWLRLERYAQGDLAADERAAIAEHLLTCKACNACVRTIKEDERELPPLPAPRSARVAWIVSGLALAAAIAFVVGRLPRDEDPIARMKGDGIAFTLVRDDETVLADAAGIYRDGDRWKALVTCPVGTRRAFDVVVYERGDAAFPLEPATGLSCGNEVPIAGAFRLTGRERLTVCLVWGDAIDREEIRRTGPDMLTHAACKVLDPAPSP
jgi:hypothetical protein